MRVNIPVLCYSLGSVRDFDWLQIGTVMSRLSRGRQLLRAQLQPYAAQAGVLQLRVRPREFCSKLLIIR